MFFFFFVVVVVDVVFFCRDNKASLKLTANKPENRSNHPKRKGESLPTIPIFQGQTVSFTDCT